MDITLLKLGSAGWTPRDESTRPRPKRMTSRTWRVLANARDACPLRGCHGAEPPSRALCQHLLQQFIISELNASGLPFLCFNRHNILCLTTLIIQAYPKHRLPYYASSHYVTSPSPRVAGRPSTGGPSTPIGLLGASLLAHRRVFRSLSTS